MFEKHITKEPTGNRYEKAGSGNYYRIWEVTHQRYIDPDKYHTYLDWSGILPEINCDPVPQTDEQKWSQIREQRTALLRGCDWTRLDDVDLTTEEKLLWKDYRKALRDLPQTYTDPDNVIWPKAPTVT